MAVDEKNVLGGTLDTCSLAPRTGFFRDGCCNTGPEDHGLHVVCAQVTAEFLQFARKQGNDLISPAPEYGFPGPSRPSGDWPAPLSNSTVTSGSFSNAASAAE